jgi:hypothetical protein
MLGKKLKEE